MAFRVTQETLEALEWPRVLGLLAERCRTAQARERLATIGFGDAVHADLLNDLAPRSLFETTLAGVRERLAETDEARALLDAEQLPPLGHSALLGPALRRAQKGGVLEVQQLGEVRAVLEMLRQIVRFLAGHRDSAPGLAGMAETIDPHAGLAREIEACIDPGGQVRDEASPALAGARREVAQLSGELQRRLERYLHNADVAAHLSDSYYTVRNDRYVLPVKADSKGRVRGIVHDASRSGTTLFIEPEAVVELNNKLKQAELSVAREVDRILRRLSAEVGRAAPSLTVGLDTLALIDLAFARGRLSQETASSTPDVREEGVLDLPALRHPLIDSDRCIPNDVRLGEHFSVLVISGPNAGGKTVTMKAVALATLMVRSGMHVPCAPGGRLDVVDHVIADIGDHQDIGENLSTFSAHMANLAEIVASAGRRSLVVLDEIGVGTDPGEGAALAQAILERLADSGARVIATTHYNLLKEIAEVDPRFCNACVEFDPETLTPTYRLHLGTPGISSASSVAARMGVPTDVLARAESLLAREDRQLDRMLAELAASRAALDSEQRRVVRIREESEATRAEYRAKLLRLQTRRDELFRAMRGDLDLAFKAAHAEVASVIRELQSGPSSRRAAVAREKLEALAEETAAAEARAGLTRGVASEPDLDAMDWRRARAGDPIRVRGGREGVLLSVPDRKGRVSVRVGTARLELPSEQVGRGAPRATDPAPAPRSARVRVERIDAGDDDLRGGTLECDLRGKRVEEAIDHLAATLDRAASEGRDGIRIIHGFGTGALRKAVREHLDASPFIRGIRTGDDHEGGDGVTLAELG